MDLYVHQSIPENNRPRTTPPCASSRMFDHLPLPRIHPPDFVGRKQGL